MLAALAIVLVALAIALHERSGGYGNLRWAFEAIYACGFVTLGLLVAHYRPGNALGPLFALLGLGTAFTAAGSEFAYLALTTDTTLPGANWVLWVASWSWASLFPVLACVYYLAPTMRLASPRWRGPFLYSVVATSTLSLAIALHPGSIMGDERGPVLATLSNPLTGASEGGALSTWYALAYPLMAIGMALAGTAAIVRYRRSEGEQRQQLRFLAVGAAMFPVIMLFGLAVPAPPGPLVAYALSTVDLAVIAEALLHRRWFGIDVVANRSLVYGTLTVVVLGLYGAVVLSVDAVVPGGASLAGAIVVAVTFTPLRSRLQGGVDRLMYGDRKDPYVAMTRLGHRLESALTPDQVLPVVVATIAESLRLPFAAIDTTDIDGNHISASWGRRSAVELERIDLPFRGKVAGSLAVQPRPGQAALSEDDRRLLGDLARQAGVAVHAVAVGAALQRSREHLVGAREEERRRMRRDLHDGLGPALTGVTLQLDVLGNVLRSDPATAESMVGALRGEVKDAIAEIRRLVYDLRPPALDELGLLGALREHAGRLGRNVVITLEADDLPPLPAAVEVAAYRIVTEAMTNVARHSGARACTIRVNCQGPSLDVCVEDDGIGTTESWRPGVGLRSMHARAAELGGSCSISSSSSGGGAIRATIPVVRS